MSYLLHSGLLLVPTEAVAVADAGPDQEVVEGDTVTLDSTASTGVTSLVWTQISGRFVTLSDDTAAQPTFTAPEVPYYRLLTEAGDDLLTEADGELVL